MYSAGDDAQILAWTPVVDDADDADADAARRVARALQDRWSDDEAN